MNTPLSSPPWSRGSKRLVTAVLCVLGLLLIYWIRGLLIYLLTAVILAYLLHPLVKFLHRQLRLPRLLAIALVYLFILAGLIAIPITTVPQLVNQFNAFINNIPRYVRQVDTLLGEPITVGDYSFTPYELPQIEEAVSALSQNLIGIAQTVGGRSVSLFGSLATATLSTLAWTLVVLFFSFYMVKDHQLLFNWLVRTVPAGYQEDVRRLGREISDTWNAFLRGQLILFAIMSTTVFTLATIAGMPNALLLGLASGLAEFLPQIGATLAMIPALLVAFFQSEASWLGQQMSPFWFTILIMVTYIALQQIENYWLVPRVIGRQLNLHPLLVFIAALVGATTAGILGILVAAPLLATGRLFLRYIYRKLMDLPPFPLGPMEAPPAAPDQLLFRPATMADETAVRQLSAQIWDGEDYIPDVFADWVADPHGQFTVVYHGDELIAFGKLTRLRQDEWWLEGLRVARQHRQQGVARELHNYAVSLADQVGSGWLRFATEARNAAVHKIALESGFRLISRHLVAEAEAVPGPTPDSFTPAGPDALPAVCAWLRESAMCAAAGGLAEVDWIWVEIEPRLPDWLADGLVYWWTPDGAAARGLVVVRPPDEGRCAVNYLDVAALDYAMAATALLQLAGALGATKIRGKPLELPGLREALTEAGWEIRDYQMCVYERPLAHREN